MSGRRVTPAQLKAIEACALGKVSKLVGAAGWICPASVRTNVLDRVLAGGFIEPGKTDFIGRTQIQTYRPTEKGRAELDAAREKACA